VEATKACYEASVLLLAVVDRKGSVSSVRVLKPASLGVDETAIAAANSELNFPSTPAPAMVVR
jgi:hypothetical protein